MNKFTPYQARILSTLALKVDAWSPGDGMTRYKLIPETQDYFSANHSYPCFLGRKELEAAIAALAIVVDILPREKQAWIAMLNPFEPETPGNVVYYRGPTKGEIRFGHGAVHYREFEPHECVNPKTNKPKKWFKSPDDGLRYNKPR
jgi:hypothetical protein